MTERALLALLGLASCVPSYRAVRDDTDALVAARAGRAISRARGASSAQVTAWLREPLTTERVAQIAVANSRRVAVALDEAGIQLADLGVLWAAPSVHADLALRQRAGAWTYEGDVLIDVLAGLRRVAGVGVGVGVGDRARELATAQAAEAIMAQAAEAERALVRVYAAAQKLALVTQAQQAAITSQTIMERAHAAGNTTTLQLLRRQEQAQRAALWRINAERDVAVAKAALNRAMGTPPDSPWGLAEAPPAALADVRNADSAEALEATVAGLPATVQRRSLSLSALRAEASLAQQQRRMAWVSAWLPELAAGVSVAEHGGAVEWGPAVRLGVPWLGASAARVDAVAFRQRKAEHLAYAVARELEADVAALQAEATQARAALARWRDELVPVRQRLVDETLLHYNAMNADLFTLLDAQRNLLDGQLAQVDAEAELAVLAIDVALMARGGRRAARSLPGTASVAAPAAADVH